MLCKKKMIALLFTVMLCMLVSPLASYASTGNVQAPDRASLYIRSTSVTAQAIGNGTLLLENMLGATRDVDQLGVKTIEVQTLRNGYWQSIYTIVTNDYRYNANTYVYDCYYYGTPGTQYRSYVEFYVADDGGSETKIVTSNPVTAY